MLKPVIYFSIAFFSASAALAQTDLQPSPDFDQEEYNRRVTKEMEEMSAALQEMSKFMVKSMNNMTQAINESIPGITKSMGEMAKSMAPIIKAAQENQKIAPDNLSQPTPPAEPLHAAPAAPTVTIPATPALPVIEEQIIIEQQSPQMIYQPRPKKIQLFPAPQPNY